MRIIERDIRMAGFEYRDKDAKVTYGSISSPLTIKDSGNKCCDEVTVIYDYFDEESKKAERIRIRYWAGLHTSNKGSRHRLYKQKDILGRNKKILAKPKLGTKDVMADYIEDFQFNEEGSSSSSSSSTTDCAIQAKADLGKMYNSQKKFYSNNSYYYSTGRACGSGGRYRGSGKNRYISFRRPVSYDRCAWGRFENNIINKELMMSQEKVEANISRSNYNIVGTYLDRKSWEYGKLKPQGYKAYAFAGGCRPQGTGSIFSKKNWIFWIDNNGNRGIEKIGVCWMDSCRGGVWRNRRKSFTKIFNWKIPNIKNTSTESQLININLTLRTKNQYGKDRQFKKKDYHDGNFKIDKTDKYKRDTFSSKVLVRNLAL
jgi:hypothetical protein